MIVISLLLTTLIGCKTHEENYTIGIITSNEYPKTPAWFGFNDGMAEWGYIQGKNLKYIIKKISEDNEKIDAAIKEILNQNPDDLPVLTAEVKLIINLKTAEKIGIHIPYGLLAQANTIIR